MVTTRSQTEAAKRPKRTPDSSKSKPGIKPTPKTKSRAIKTSNTKKKLGSLISDSKSASKSSKQPTRNKTSVAGESAAVLEKGILYFFARPKVDIGDDPHTANDIQRSFLVLRPVEGHDDTGPASKNATCRILVVPKKRLPDPSKHDRFLTFIKEPEVIVADVASQFKSSMYMTKTKGERTQPAAVPVAEAVYALIASADGKATHLAYMLTIPETLSAVQTELGIRKEGSFVAQVRNPAFPAPPQAGVPEPPSYLEEIMSAFEGKRWMPLRPEHLKFKHAEVLLIAAHTDVSRDGKEDEAPVKEMEELEHEEERRVENLGEDDAVFKDLRLRTEEFKKELNFRGTWGDH